MYKWYKDAWVWYAYLTDVLWKQGLTQLDEVTMDQFRKSAWFTRGWTLQELLAPKTVYFFDKNWRCMGTKDDLVHEISDITGINTVFLLFEPDKAESPCTRNRQCRGHMPSWVLDNAGVRDASVPTRMSWASKRQTTRIEDMAYCLLGIFDVNMPLLYGEGRKAFKRLQHEIIKQTDDESIFAWTADLTMTGVLAHSPTNFVQS
ncbi:MAG: hypothetical protein L6R40_008710, partial [Gallowayella cf. fulva]